jgi:hypothetical protein
VGGGGHLAPDDWSRAASRVAEGTGGWWQCLGVGVGKLGVGGGTGASGWRCRCPMAMSSYQGGDTSARAVACSEQREGRRKRSTDNF